MLLFLFYIKSMYHKYLPCQILSHKFDEKSHFLNYKFSIRLPTISQFKNGWVQKRELGWGRMWCHAIKTSKQTWLYFSMQKKRLRFVFYPSFCVFIYACLGKVMLSSRCVVLIGWHHKKTADTNNSGPTIWWFEYNGGHLFDKFTWDISWKE